MKTIFALVAICVFVPTLAYASSAASCQNNLAGVARFDIPGSPKDSLREEMVAEKSRILRAYFKQAESVATPVAEAMQLPLRIQNIQEMALESGGHFNGWEVSKLSKPYGDLYNFSEIANTLGDKKLVLLENGTDAILLNTASLRGVNHAEIIVLKNKNSKNKQAYVFGVRNLDQADRPEPVQKTNMTPGEIEAQLDAHYKVIFRGYGTPGGARMANLALADVLGKRPLNLGTKIRRWEKFNRSFLTIAPKLGLKKTFTDIAELHQEQKAIRNQEVSNFIYDDRGSISSVSSVKLPTGELISALEGSKLLNINAYAATRFVIDVPRPQDKSVRIWTWDGRDSFKPEFYVLPLVAEIKDIGPQAESTDNQLPYLYKQILDIEFELRSYNENL